MGIYTRHMPDEGEWELLKLSPKEAARAALLKGLHNIDGDACFRQCLFTEWDDSEKTTRGKLPTEREQAEFLKQYGLLWKRLFAALTKGVTLPYDDVRNICNPTPDDFK